MRSWIDRKSLILQAILLALYFSSLDCASCPNGWVEYDQHCYFFSTSQYDFDTARDICRSREGDLVSMNSREEREMIEGVAKSKGIMYWIGMIRNPDNSDDWIWVDNSTPKPTDDDIVNWASSHPKPNQDSNCVQMWITSLKWQNILCSYRRGYICKRPNSIHDVCDVEGNWHAYDTHCYKYFEELRDWNDARSMCQADNGDLAVLETQSKWTVLSQVIGCTDYERGIWLGLSDTDTPGTYKWVDGKSVTQSNWDKNMPPASGVSPGDNCVHSFPLNSFKWRTSNCGNENHFACMREKSTCYPGWMDFNSGACYQYFGVDPSSSLSWSDADRYCSEVGKGGRLMKVTNQAQQDALKEITKDMLASGVERVRIGLSDKFQDNVFRWSDNTIPSFTNWGSQTATDNRWDCVYVSTNDPEAMWQTGYCFTLEAFICQLPAFADPGEVNPPPELWQCEEGWIVDQRKGDCYLVGSDEDRQPYGQVVSTCISQSAAIITIRDENDQSFITSIMRHTTFLGLEYNAGSGRFEWADGSQVTFQNWDSQNDPSVNQVARMSMSPNIGSWVSEQRNSEHNYICRKKAVSTTATPTSPGPTLPWSPQCGPGWSHDPLGSSCYMVNQEAMTWTNARAYCQQQDSDADLASITGPDDQSFINAMLANTIISGSRVFWTGGNDIDPSSGWKWTDGSPFAYLNWYDGEPNNWEGNEWCIELTHAGDRNGRWFDHGCDTLYKSICKKPSADKEMPPTPPPPTPPPVCNSPEALVTGRHYLQDMSFFASSAQANREAYKSRLDSTVIQDEGGGGWSAESSDNTPHLGLAFHTPVHAIKIITQGAQDKDEWVTTYRVSYKLGRADQWLWARDDDGGIIDFAGNTDRSSKVENALTSNGILASTIRIFPQQFNGGASMRVEISGCKYGECASKEYLVSGESMVPDERMTASGSWDEFHAPHRARIHSVKEDIYRGGWVANAPWTDQQWIQVEFDVHMTVLTIETLGRQDYPQWSDSYKLLFSNDGQNWETYQEPYGTEKIFTGNNDQHTLVVNELYAPMRAKFVRINPQKWTNGVSLRLEISGCRSVDCAANAVISGENHYLDENRLTASSFLDANHGPGRSRLHQAGSGSQAGGWVPEFQDNQQWIQVDLGYDIEVVGVATQGQHGEPNYIKQYYVSHSLDLARWYNHSETGDGMVTLFDGNLDETKARKHYFARRFRARAVRVHPTEWNNYIAVRWEVYGCPGVGSMKYMGCFGDAQDRDLPHALLSQPPGGMTRELCVLHCFNRDYSYAGVQYTRECHCGNSYGKYGISSLCTSLCTGKPTETCGGTWANDIMYTGISAMYERCLPGWMAFGNDCYLFVLESTTWEDAEYQCKYLAPNTHLATVNSPEQQQFVESQLAIHKRSFWIGLHCKKLNNYFEWVNGEAVKYTNWHRREPNDWADEEDCAMIYSHGTWNDDPCDNRRNYAYICQQPKQSYPNQPTPAPDPGCGDNWVGYRWKCYSIVTATSTWSSGKSTCEAYGGYLARIEDPYEQAYLSSQLADRGSTGYYWTDLSNQDQDDGIFIFSNGQPPSNTFWALGKPESNEEDTCVAMHATDHGAWRNLRCADNLHYICEKPNELVSKPTGLPTQPPSGECANGWQPLGLSDCIQVNNPTPNFHRSWFDALADCQSKGADLVSIHSDVINNQVLAQILSTSYGFWIGLNSLDEGFQWTDGTPVEYTKWNTPDQPGEDPTENCVEMLPSESGQWATTDCSANKPWFCKARRGASVLTTSTIAPPTAGPPGSCSPDSDDWKMYNGRCFFFSPRSPTEIEGKLNWYSAQSFCNDRNAHLASIHDLEENNFVMGQVMTVENFDLWIGLNHLNLNQGWSWIDGSPVDFRLWGEGQPDNAGGNELCATMAVAHNNMGFWSDKHCQSELGFICVKYPNDGAVTTPQPPPLLPGNCPEGWLAFQNKCYKFYEEIADWNTAASTCKTEVPDPYSLATFDNIWDMYFIMSHLRNTQRVYWIGLYQFHGSDGQFGWVDNSPVRYTNWNAGEPNGGTNEGCVEMYTGPWNAGKWNDVACASELPFICMQMKSESFPDPQPPPNPCISNDFVEYEGNCYKIASARDRTWQEAEDHCQEDPNGHLASIHSIYEQAFVSYYYHMRDYNIWIGLTDQQNKGRYYWADGSAIQYTNWHPSQPDMDSPACVYMSHNDDALWFDDDCNTGKKAMCEIYKEPPPFTRPPGGLCPAASEGIDWIEYGDSCYYFQMDNPVSFGDAQTACARLGATLASVHSEEENDFIVTHSLSQTLHWVWLGLIRAQGGGWGWLDGQALQFTNWNDGEPSDPDGSNGENCGELYPTVGFGKWNDVSCSITNDFVCKTPMIYDPGQTVPSTTAPTESSPGGSGSSTGSSQPVSTTVGQSGSSQPSTRIPSITPPIGIDSNSGLSAGQTAGIVFGVFIAIIVIGTLAFIIFRRNTSLGLGSSSGLVNPSYSSSSGVSFGSQPSLSSA